MRFAPDHRWGRRWAAEARVRFFALPATFGTGTVTNVSVSGAYLETLLSLPIATIVYIEGISAPGPSGGRRRMAANVVRRDTTGVGLEWSQTASTTVLNSQFAPYLEDGGRQPLPDQEAPGGMYVYQFDFQD